MASVLNMAAVDSPMMTGADMAVDAAIELQNSGRQLFEEIGLLLLILVFGVVGFFFSRYNGKGSSTNAKAKQLEAKISEADKDEDADSTSCSPTTTTAETPLAQTSVATATVLAAAAAPTVPPVVGDGEVLGVAQALETAQSQQEEELVLQELACGLLLKSMRAAEESASKKKQGVVDFNAQPSSVQGQAIAVKQTEESDIDRVASSGLAEAEWLASRGKYEAARRQITSTCRELQKAMRSGGHGGEACASFMEKANKLDASMRLRELQDPLPEEEESPPAPTVVAEQVHQPAVPTKRTISIEPATVEKQVISIAPAVTKSMVQDEARPQLRTKHLSQLVKTEMCKFFLLGRCGKGPDCVFAHSFTEIRNKPNLDKTSMCRNFLQTGNCNNPKCTFAHTENELRTTSFFHKTKMCKFADSGRCKHGSECRFAHDASELGPQEAAPGSEKAENVPMTADPSGLEEPVSVPAPPPGLSAPPGLSKPDIAAEERTRRGGDKMGSRHCTTLMVTNLPTFLTQAALLNMLEDQTVEGCTAAAFDFFYCPWDTQADSSLGYAIINFFSRSQAAVFEQRWSNQPLLPQTHGAKKLKITPAALQGRSANIRHFAGFNLVSQADLRFRPLVRPMPNEELRPMALGHEMTAARDALETPSKAARISLSLSNSL